MTYSEATEYLFNSAPLFQNIGAGAYKEGLYNTEALDEHFGHPHTSYKTIHVGGTNGKGSVSHTLAAILQCSGYKVGLYTSPHLIDFRERIRVNGEMIPRERVIKFVEEERAFFEPLHPSFFELATALALKYFEEEEVDVAVIEVGLGGRLDCTNIISPVLSIITNISKDHVQFLGDTLPKIASEKAGIIKHDIPVVIGEYGNESVKKVFVDKALSVNTKIIFAQELDYIKNVHSNPQGGRNYETSFGTLHGELGGLCQEKNTQTILTATDILKESFHIEWKDIKEGFGNVTSMTGLMGRWQKQNDHPLVICDTGHNTGGWEYLSQQLNELKKTHHRLHIVVGMVGDKDVSTVLSMMPKDARYYFTQASVKRAMPVDEFAQIAEIEGLKGNRYDNVRDAYSAALAESGKDDAIFVGGSTFIVADFLMIK